MHRVVILLCYSTAGIQASQLLAVNKKQAILPNIMHIKVLQTRKISTFVVQLFAEEMITKS